MRISIPILITDGGDGSVGLSIFKTIEDRNRYMDQEEKLFGFVCDEGDRTIDLEVDSKGNWTLNGLVTEAELIERDEIIKEEAE